MFACNLGVSVFCCVQMSVSAQRLDVTAAREHSTAEHAPRMLVTRCKLRRVSQGVPSHRGRSPAEKPIGCVSPPICPSERIWLVNSVVDIPTAVCVRLTEHGEPLSGCQKPEVVDGCHLACQAYRIRRRNVVRAQRPLAQVIEMKEVAFVGTLGIRFRWTRASQRRESRTVSSPKPHVNVLWGTRP